MSNKSMFQERAKKCLYIFRVNRICIGHWPSSTTGILNMGNNESRLLARKTFLDISVNSPEKLSTNVNWDHLFKLETTSFENIVELMPEKELKLLKDTNLENLAILIEKCIVRLAFLTNVEILEDLRGAHFLIILYIPKMAFFHGFLIVFWHYIKVIMKNRICAPI